MSAAAICSSKQHGATPNMSKSYGTCTEAYVNFADGTPSPCTDGNLCEAHHVHWLSRGGDDALHNMVLICPNHHRAIHRTDAPFDWVDASFVFPRNREPVQISRHALQAQ